MQSEFDRLPYPLTPLEDAEESYQTASGLEAVVDVDRLLNDLEDLIQRWRDACGSERRQLTRPHESGDLPLEYRAGLAQGLEDAAAELERVLEDARAQIAAARS